MSLWQKGERKVILYVLRQVGEKAVIGESAAAWTLIVGLLSFFPLSLCQSLSPSCPVPAFSSSALPLPSLSPLPSLLSAPAVCSKSPSVSSLPLPSPSLFLSLTLCFLLEELSVG